MKTALNYFMALLLGLLPQLCTAEPIEQSKRKDVITPALVSLEKTLLVDGTHLIVPVCNGKDGKPFPKDAPNFVVLGIYDGSKLVQSISVSLPQFSDTSWLTAYPLDRYGLKGKSIKLSTVDGKKASDSLRTAFDRIKIGSASDAFLSSDYTQPYRNQFHASTRRGWNNDPNGMVFADGIYHLYYQHNPFGIFWGNMHWGHLQSSDLIHWEEKPIAIPQKLVQGGIWSGGGFLDFNNSAGFGQGTQFAAFTSPGGEHLAYSQDNGLTFQELPENPVVRHTGRDPKIIYYSPEKKWVMAVFDGASCAETEATPPAKDSPEDRKYCNIAFYESKNLRQWKRTGAFTDPERKAVFECPELFQLPILDKPGESRWILLAAQNRYFIGNFDGKTFHQESGPLGTSHGAFYAAQTFSDVPDGRRIQIGWVPTDIYLKEFPDQMVNQAFTLPHELTLRETKDGLRMFFWPVKETEGLREQLLVDEKNLSLAKANQLLRKYQTELTEVWIEFAKSGSHPLLIRGMDASFNGTAARIYSDRTFNEVYAQDGLSYEIRKMPAKALTSPESHLTALENTLIPSLKIYRLQSIWPQEEARQKKQPRNKVNI
jgi:fructan beta-fructosidase